MRAYEIEIKSLLGGEKKANELREKLKKTDPATKLVSKNKQLNHYFIGGDPKKLYQAIAPLLADPEAEKLKRIIDEGHDFSIRTREIDGKAFLVVKASVDDTTSANGIARIEFEEEVKDTSLDELDRLLLTAGFTYQAKWSREREEYVCRDVSVSIDKNAGYGYVAEFEEVVRDESESENAQKRLRSLMEEVGATELPQDRLERMFAYYNEHWPEYYGTDKFFVVE